MVGEAGEMGAVLLREEGLDLFTLFGVVQQEGVVGAGGEAKFA
jgi:hypothetical protein